MVGGGRKAAELNPCLAEVFQHSLQTFRSSEASPIKEMLHLCPPPRFLPCVSKCRVKLGPRLSICSALLEGTPGDFRGPHKASLKATQLMPLSAASQELRSGRLPPGCLIPAAPQRTLLWDGRIPQGFSALQFAACRVTPACQKCGTPSKYWL